MPSLSNSTLRLLRRLLGTPRARSRTPRPAARPCSTATPRSRIPRPASAMSPASAAPFRPMPPGLPGVWSSAGCGSMPSARRSAAGRRGAARGARRRHRAGADRRPRHLLPVRAGPRRLPRPAGGGQRPPVAAGAAPGRARCPVDPVRCSATATTPFISAPRSAAWCWSPPMCRRRSTSR
jgi:hypothetical protein